MNRDTALRIPGEHRAELELEGVESISLFGSVARNAAGPDSDVDFGVDWAVVWRTVEERLPSLVPQLRSILDENP